jgi:alpha-beta hydrolase superfamily lysophospholipase
MKTVITADNLRSFAYLNSAVLVGEPRGLVLEFKGLGGMDMYGEDTPRGVFFGKRGVLYCVPYLDPWSWMNPFAVRETDEIVDAVFSRYGTLPLVSTGGSMGGLACLVYTRYGKITPAVCAANCPVCDLPYHYTEREDLPRTLYAAFGASGEETLEDAMKKASPLHLAEAGEMPAIPYAVFHCTADRAVNKETHSDRFVAALREYAPVRYVPVEGRGHCDLGPVWADFDQAILSAVNA